LIAIDSSSLIAFFSGSDGRDVDLVDRALAERQACLPPVVLTELLSDPQLPARVANLLGRLPRLDVHDGYWERVGRLRAAVISKGRKARLADALIGQSCMDHEVALVTRDRDFRNFARVGSLKLLP